MTTRPNDPADCDGEPRGAIPWFVHENPYPWQVRMYRSLRTGVVPESVYLPTGTGKTTVALLYLLALIQGAPLPRRLVYVVDRRAIVDQTRDAVASWTAAIAAQPELRDRLDAMAAFPTPDGDDAIPVGVLRGGVVDSGEWRMDPARPSVVVGTVDMIGSRLLFSGYGDGRTRRPLHAGLLGHDATILLDEAHLSAPMADLLRSLAAMQQSNGCRGGVRSLRVMAMSATPTSSNRPTWTAHDERDAAFRARLHAPKRLRLHVSDRKDIVRTVVKLATAPALRGSILLYLRTVKDAKAVHGALVRKTRDTTRVGLLTGTLRGRERDELLSSPVWRRSAPASCPPSAWRCPRQVAGVELKAGGTCRRIAGSPRCPRQVAGVALKKLVGDLIVARPLLR